ncbi:MAG TPA: hypothetical protein DIT35_03555 [Rhodospirillaceae bacterium]|nr:hypothetical protein [Rhodospirillaceae bacterium]
MVNVPVSQILDSPSIAPLGADVVIATDSSVVLARNVFSNTALITTIVGGHGWRKPGLLRDRLDR